MGCMRLGGMCIWRGQIFFRDAGVVLIKRYMVTGICFLRRVVCR